MGSAASQFPPEVTGLQDSGEHGGLRFPWCAYVGISCMMMGIITTIIIWACALSSFGFTTAGLGVYLIIIGIPITMLEFSWLINKCGCLNGEGFMCTAWRITLMLDFWKRGLAYILASIPCFIIVPFFMSVLGILCGIFLIVTGVLYILRTFQFTSQPMSSMGGQSAPGFQDPTIVGRP